MDAGLHGSAGPRAQTSPGARAGTADAEVRPCVLIPIYDHGREIREVVKALVSHSLPCLIVDDGSHAATRAVLDEIERDFPFVEVHRHASNRGKGEALKTGYRISRERGYSHAIQMDADGQHDASDLPRFVAAIAADPDALVLGAPRFDESAPWVRLAGRQVSRAAIWISTLSFDVEDPLCGFRGIPLGPTLARVAAVRTGSRMDFEPELVVRLFWDGLRIVNVPTRVVYHPGGTSHFHYVRDNRKILGLYLRLLGGMAVRAPSLVRRRLRRDPRGARG